MIAKIGVSWEKTKKPREFEADFVKSTFSNEFVPEKFNSAGKLAMQQCRDWLQRMNSKHAGPNSKLALTICMGPDERMKNRNSAMDPHLALVQGRMILVD